MSLHGYFAGGSMYTRESELLASRFGWRVVNPSLPGFGGSDPLPDAEVTMAHLTDEISRIREHLGIDRMVLLGHSMGAAVAMHYAAIHPERGPRRALPRRHRDPVVAAAARCRRATARPARCPTSRPSPTWSPPPRSTCPTCSSATRSRRCGSMLPDLRHNFRTFSRSQPIASMLMHLDLSDDVRAVRAAADPGPRRVGLLRPAHPAVDGHRVRRGRGHGGALGPRWPLLDAREAERPGRRAHPDVVGTRVPRSRRRSRRRAGGSARYLT